MLNTHSRGKKEDNITESKWKVSVIGTDEDKYYKEGKPKGRDERTAIIYWKWRLYWRSRCVRGSDEEWEEEGLIVGLVRRGRERREGWHD